MIKMISAVTGAVMMVHEDRVEEYLERGHRMVPPPPPPPKKPRKKAETKE